MDVPIEPKKRSPVAIVAIAAVVLVAGGAVAKTLLGGGGASSVDRNALVIGTVVRGELKRTVSANGRLVPKSIRWLSATVSGRVTELAVGVGAKVEADTVLLEIENSDLALQLLQAKERQAAAESELSQLRAEVRDRRLESLARIAKLRTEHELATRRREADQRLVDQGYLAGMELATSRSNEEALSKELKIAELRSKASSESLDAQLNAAQARVERERAAVALQETKIEQGLRVRAGTAGVVQALPVEQGQSVQVGAMLAKVVVPGALKAELQVPEAQVKDLTVSMPVRLTSSAGDLTGVVERIDPSVSKGRVKVDVRLPDDAPKGLRPDESVQGVVEIERLDDVMYISRPALGRPHTVVPLFVLNADGDSARRVECLLGASSLQHIVVERGLSEGDRVVLSDTSQWDDVERIELR
ncbi:MAG: HlyD family efflux transporter periplasmic adaptor subunit [Myxococcota bacterium]